MKPTAGEIAFSADTHVVTERQHMLMVDDGMPLTCKDRSLAQNAANRAHLCLCWNTHEELLHLVQLLESSLIYEISKDDKAGDDEGARMKSVTLHAVRNTIAKATGVCLALLFCCLSASAQMIGRFNLNARRVAEPISPITRPVVRRATVVQASAMIYVATAQGVTAYEAVDGILTQAGGSYAVAGNLVGATATDLITIDADTVYDYALSPDGPITGANATAAPQRFTGAECGAIASASVAGGYVYVQLAGAEDAEGDNVCDAIQTYKAGTLTFEGATTYDQGRFAEAGTQPVMSGGYAFSTTPEGQACEQWFDTFSVEKSGTLDAIASTAVTNPQANPLGGGFFPMLMTADSSNHLAVALVQDFDPPCGTMGGIQLASYTVAGDGSIFSSNDYQTMPAAGTDVEAMAINQASTLLAVGGDGLLLYGFNGGAAITPTGNNLLPGAAISALGWDSAGYLYAWGVSVSGVYECVSFGTESGAIALAWTSAMPGSTAMVVVSR